MLDASSIEGSAANPLREPAIHDLDMWQEAVPYERFARLRCEDPVAWQATHDGDGKSGFWSVTKHADVVEVSKDPATFSAWQWGNLIDNPPEDQLPMRRSMLLNMDPPEHNLYRRLVLDSFTPRMVAGLESRIRDRARSVIETALDKGEVDFVRDLTTILPVNVMCELMGVPEADRAQIADWNAQLIGFDDPELGNTPEDALGAGAGLFTYGMELAKERVGGTGTDLVTILSNATLDGGAIDEVQFHGLFVQMIVAGSETTQTLLTGGMNALFEHSEQLRRLRDNPALIPGAVEEMLRWVTPIHHFRRTATRDTELGGARIAKGDAVVMWYVSANRDEDAFADPEVFDITRSDADRQLAFGHGTHFCLGAHLGRLEAKIFFEELFSLCAEFEQTGPPRRLRSNLINGIKELPVRLGAAR